MCLLVLIPPRLPDILYGLMLEWWWNTSTCWEGRAQAAAPAPSSEQDLATGLVHPLYYWYRDNGMENHLNFKLTLNKIEKKNIPE